MILGPDVATASCTAPVFETSTSKLTMPGSDAPSGATMSGSASAIPRRIPCDTRIESGEAVCNTGGAVCAITETDNTPTTSASIRIIDTYPLKCEARQNLRPQFQPSNLPRPRIEALYTRTLCRRPDLQHTQCSVVSWKLPRASPEESKSPSPHDGRREPTRDQHGPPPSRTHSPQV